MTLTPDQQNIFEGVVYDIKEALIGDIYCDHTFISISGAAGTGKTFLSHSIVENIVTVQNKTVAVLAPTHKALKVIKSNINVDSPNITYATVHSFLGLKPKIDFKTGEQTFVKDTSKMASALSKKRVDVMIVDESSFISTALFEHIKKELLVHNRVNVVLFIGDRLQLLPVEDQNNISSENKEIKHAIFDESGSNIINHYNLTKVIRNGNVEVLDFYTEVRKMVERKATQAELFDFLRKERDKEHHKIKFFSSKQDFFKDYLSEDRLGIEDDVIVTFTNKTVNDYNQTIRDFYIKQKYPHLTEIPELVQEDLFVVQSGDEDFINSETIALKRFNPKTFNFFGKEFEGYYCETTDGRTFNKILAKSKPDYERSLELLRLNALKQKTQGSWQTYYKLLGLFLDVKYVYSSTCHKAQGSSFTNVYVDMTGIDYLDNDTILRLFYVACTRAKDMVKILL